MSNLRKVEIFDGTNTADIMATDGMYGLVTMTPAHESTLNSYSGTIASGATWTGTAENVLHYGVISIIVTSTLDTATDGFLLEYSVDGITWVDGDNYTLEANETKIWSIQCAAKYYRISITNGSGGVATISLQTILKPYYVKPSSHRINDVISPQDDAELVKAVLTAQNNFSNLFVPITASKSNNLNITDAESSLAIAKGEVIGHLPVTKFANAKDFDTGDGRITIWDGADDGTAWELMNYVYSTIADIDSISSSDATDTIEITIIGQTLDGTEVTQNKTLQGQTRVALDTPLRRVYRSYNNNSTSLVGHVIIYVNTPLTLGVPTDKTKIRSVIDPFNQQTLMGVYTIPKGYTGYLKRGYASTSGANKTSNYIITFLTREFGKVFRTQNLNSISDAGSSFIILDYDIPLRLPELTDLEIKAEMTAVGGTAASVSAGFDIVLVAN